MHFLSKRVLLEFRWNVAPSTEKCFRCAAAFVSIALFSIYLRFTKSHSLVILRSSWITNTWDSRWLVRGRRNSNVWSHQWMYSVSAVFVGSRARERCAFPHFNSFEFLSRIFSRPSSSHIIHSQCVALKEGRALVFAMFAGDCVFAFARPSSFACRHLFNFFYVYLKINTDENETTSTIPMQSMHSRHSETHNRMQIYVFFFFSLILSLHRVFV